eukprot:scaffold24_cov341-Pavlova_lutheri.AAC.11
MDEWTTSRRRTWGLSPFHPGSAPDGTRGRTRSDPGRKGRETGWAEDEDPPIPSGWAKPHKDTGVEGGETHGRLCWRV